MARGFESKAVADQQEAREAGKPVRGDVIPAERKTLELARADVEQRLRTATSGAHREMLQRALDGDRRRHREALGWKARRCGVASRSACDAEYARGVFALRARRVVVLGVHESAAVEVSRIATTAPRRQRHRVAWPGSGSRSAGHALPARPRPTSGSMIPQRTPIHSFSARCASAAMRTRIPGQVRAPPQRRARPTTSSAADDERPAPMGTSPATTPSHPRSAAVPPAGAPRPCRRCTRPSPRPLRTSPGRSRASRRGSGSAHTTRSSGRGRSAMLTQRSMASGSTNPSL